MKKVSVIIPVYNVEAYICQCVKSVLDQTYTNIECIIVDDCGSDNSIKIIEQYVAKLDKYGLIKIIHQENNRGLSEARNAGIKESVGDYLFFLDGDDYISTTAISEMMKLVDEYSADFVISSICSFGDTSNNVNYLKIRDDIIYGNQAIAICYSESKWYMMAQNKLISKNLIIDNDLFFYPGIYHEDELWSLRLACCAKSMAICHENTYFYRIHSSSITSKITKKHIRDLLLIIKESVNLLNHAELKCLYSPVRTLYLRVIALLNISSFDSEFRQSIYAEIIFFYWYSLKNPFLYPICMKNWIKYLICLIPLPLLSFVLKHIRIWR
ncbi:hypothetical protein B5F32_05375 [Parabacteroides distasonis]|uniref:Glycosyltransferase 2-like domain-containing protein n=1 Tax=Parabacteroides distasonis TaxID=823 RepID=A0A1Y4IP39_PARDI|nr:glycosyltransferase family 2 protein [Parabacteroides distasonis]OUP21236.1 hypothetical protein B5F32_05375 [Parabacteroides distasonis]